MNSDVATAQGATSAADAATTDKAGDWFLSHSAGSGPYKLESYTEGDKLVLARNDNYWGAEQAGVPRGHARRGQGLLVAAAAAAAGRRRHRHADLASTRSRSSRAAPTSPTSRSTRTTSCTSPSARARRAARSWRTPTCARRSSMAIDYDGAIRRTGRRQGQAAGVADPQRVHRQRRPAAAGVQPRRRQEAARATPGWPTGSTSTRPTPTPTSTASTST